MDTAAVTATAPDPAGHVVDRLVDAHLLDPARREQALGVVAGALAPVPPGPAGAARGMSALVEVVAYLGAALVLAASGLFAATLWDDLGFATQVGVVGVAGLALGVDHGYPVIAACMVVMTVGLRTVMTICAVALVSAAPADRTSLAASLNDTAQEVGTSVGTAVVGTLIAALVTASLPAGTWSPELVTSFFHGERVAFTALAVVVGLVAGLGATTLTGSRSIDEHADTAS